MDRISIRHLLLLAVLLGSATSPAGDALAAPSDKRTLVIRGRVTDAKGWPVAAARVVTEGSRRLKATTDDAGQYTLNLSLGSGAELARSPVSLRVHAERRGWRFALPSGEVELGLDLRVVAGSDGRARCEVRSNQAAVGGAVVRALKTDGDATSVAAVNFLGVEGEEIGSPPALDLPLVESVILFGVEAVSPRPVPVALPPAPRPAEKPAAEKPPAERPPAREPEKPGPTVTKVAPDTTPATAAVKPVAKKEEKAPAKPPAPATPKPDVRAEAPPPEKSPAREEAKARPQPGPTEAEKAAAREEARRLREQAKERDRLAKQDRDAQKAREKEEARERRAAEEEAKQAREAEERRWRSLRQEVQLIAGATDTVPPPPVKSLDQLAGSPSHPQHRNRTLAPRRIATRRDTIPVQPPRELPAPPADAVSAPLGGGVAGSSPVRPKPEGEPRQRSGPLVIRTPSPQPPAPGDSCTCRIEGTIEVDWDKPLPARTRVVVSLSWYPAIADTVELFMGSPRGFTLPAAPCGPQHLRLVNLGALKFDVTSRDAMATFRCESGALRQFRIVLRPR